MTYRNLNEMPRIVKLKKESPQRRLSLVIMQVLMVRLFAMWLGKFSQKRESLSLCFCLFRDDLSFLCNNSILRLCPWDSS